jgi:UDPglucose--hexose-1-phosphate uridylyltransferase
MFKVDLTKPDGRPLVLYSRRSLEGPFDLGRTLQRSGKLQSHLRWHPLREEWVAYASHRQNRTFLPPPEYNPLAVMRSAEIPTELPAGDYDIAVFENLFPSFYLTDEIKSTENGTTLDGEEELVTAAALGRCEVVVFTQDPQGTLASLPLSHIRLLIDVWSDRYSEMSKIPGIRYVMPFENRGVEMGVTLHHPHGQIYAYSSLPPVPAAMLKSQKSYWEKNHRGLLTETIERELKLKKRIIFESELSVAFVPAWARFPYEVWIAPRRAVASSVEMTAAERDDFAKALKTVLLKYENLWQRPFPYLMVAYAAPFDGETHPEWHFHLEFSPPYRTKDRLKFLAGTELGGGFFINDSLPEQKAQELQQVEVQID